jgi:hypothetical protein
VLKDTLGIGCTFFISSAMIRMLLLRKPMLREILILIACVQILTAIKVYLLFTLAGSLGLWMMFRFGSGLHPILRLASLPIVAGIVGIGAGVAIIRAAEQSDSFNSFETIENRLEGYHTDHGRRVDASVYSLGEVEYTPIGLLSKLPASVIVTLFRPFPWEIKNIVMLVSSIESTLYLLFTLWVLFKAGILGSLRSLLGNPEILMALSFTVALGFIVGISSYNFGALVRFKIPLLPFYGTFLAIMYGKYVAGDRPPATPQASSSRR